MSEKRTKPTCPECFSQDVVPILYGLPNGDARGDAESGKIRLGGCCVEDDSPEWYCRDCHHEWGPPSKQVSATRDSWKTLPMPKRREQIAFDRTLSQAEFDKFTAGHIPEAMEDKWFIFWEDGWLNFHRSWTGFCIFRCRLAETETGWRVMETWVNRAKSQYTSQNAQDDLELLNHLFMYF